VRALSASQSAVPVAPSASVRLTLVARTSSLVQGVASLMPLATGSDLGDAGDSPVSTSHGGFKF